MQMESKSYVVVTKEDTSELLYKNHFRITSGTKWEPENT